jgi:hypothetical protein
VELQTGAAPPRDHERRCKSGVSAVQVHATLALAAATAIDPDTQRAEWREVAGNLG